MNVPAISVFPFYFRKVNIYGHSSSINCVISPFQYVPTDQNMMNPFRPVLASRVNGIGVEIVGFSALMPVPSFSCAYMHDCM